jgi:cell division protein FtsI/penicillin-binding protein 2
VGIGQGYWTATPIQMNKALMILINDGVVKVPHLLQSTVEDGKPVPWVSRMSRRWATFIPASGKSPKTDVRRGQPRQRYRAQIFRQRAV